MMGLRLTLREGERCGIETRGATSLVITAVVVERGTVRLLVEHFPEPHPPVESILENSLEISL